MTDTKPGNSKAINFHGFVGVRTGINEGTIENNVVENEGTIENNVVEGDQVKTKIVFQVDKTQSSPTGVPRQAPQPPRHFIERPEVSRELKQSLFSDATTQTGVLVVSAIYGLGGIGKSTLAAALAHDPEVLSHFPDGVLWATLGQQPDLLSFLNGWIQALRDYDFKPTTPEVASRHLQTLLTDKAALLVVDDVWSPEHFEFFRVGSAGCRVLVTTREAPIQGANRYNLDVMTPEQALELLKCSIVLTEEEEKLAKVLAETVGYLPLALELAAAQVADGISWEELLDDLNEEIADLEALDLPGADDIESESVRKRYSLLASFNLSLRRLKPKQLQWFAWLGVLPEDVSITPALATTLWELDKKLARKALQNFKSKALLLSGSPKADKTPTYRLHDLLHDIARRLLTAPGSPESKDMLPGLGLMLAVAHAQLLERYRAKTEKGLWHTLPDDGYIHAYLSWHLVQADRVDELHQLLEEETDAGRNAWSETCDRLGQPAIFVEDVARAWQQTDGAFESDPSRAIALQCRYALIMSSLNSLAGNIPAELMAALVKHGLWTPAQGLAYARQIQDPEGRAKALGELAGHISEIPHLSENLLAEALSTAGAIQDEKARAKALSALASHLPENLLAEALSTAGAIQDEKARAKALSALASHLPENLLAEALSTTGAIQDEYRRADALCALAAYLPENLLVEALSTAGAIQSEYWRAEALNALAAHMSENIFAEAPSTAGAIQSEKALANALSALAPHLPEILPEALSTARAIQDEYRRAKALSALVAHMSENLLAKAFSRAGAIQSEKARADALSALVPHLSENLLAEALSMAREIQEPYHRSCAFSGIAGALKRWPANFSLWQETLHILVCRRRRDFLEDLVKLVPVMIELGGVKSLPEIVRAIIDVGRQWP